MNNKIGPALTAEEWAEARRVYVSNTDAVATTARGLFENRVGVAGVIAALNAALPDSDPRKITREMVAFLRSWQKECAESYNSNMEDDAPTFAALADALESYLPPKP